MCLRQTPVVDDEQVLDLDTAGYQTGTRLAPDWRADWACRLGVQTPPPTVFLLRCRGRYERRHGGIAMRPCRRQKGPDGIMCWDDHMAKWDVRAWSDHILIHQLPLIVNQLNGHDRCQRNLSISRTIGALFDLYEEKSSFQIGQGPGLNGSNGRILGGRVRTMSTILRDYRLIRHPRENILSVGRDLFHAYSLVSSRTFHGALPLSVYSSLLFSRTDSRRISRRLSSPQGTPQRMHSQGRMWLETIIRTRCRRVALPAPRGFFYSW